MPFLVTYVVELVGLGCGNMLLFSVIAQNAYFSDRISEKRVLQTLSYNKSVCTISARLYITAQSSQLVASLLASSLRRRKAASDGSEGTNLPPDGFSTLSSLPPPPCRPDAAASGSSELLELREL